ncbi:MAG: NUDIX domain-containing protein [Treponemataceae bacterium]|nr:NUDIX domain-containing protein [Treponemataceae bacterium]
MKTSVAGIAVFDSLVFIARRIDVGQMAGRWEFPGGKVEEGEVPEEALRREFKEEFNTEISVGSQIATGYFVHNDIKVKLIAYEVFFCEEDINWILTEHTEVKWVELDKIPRDNFVDSDLMLYDEIRHYYEGKYEKSKKTE